jgi:hypothetical protein
MSKGYNLDIPIRVLEAHNKVVQRAGSKAAKERVSRKVFESLRQQFYDRTDARARSNPASLHHVYEWGQVGDPGGRLFKMTSRGRGTGMFEISYDLLESKMPNRNGYVFEQKAYIMENGVPVSISPVNGEKLVFEVDGETVYAAGPVEVDNPGGEVVQGSLRGLFMSITTPSALQRNQALKVIIEDEMRQAMSEIRKARR